MQLENPYLPPAEGEQGAGETVIDDKSCAADRCPHCGVAITFVAMLCQGTPFRFRCLRCGERSAIRAPGLVKALILTICFALVIVVLLPFIHHWYGLDALIGGLMVTLVCFFAIEWFWCRHIRKTGRMHPIQRR
ncbi:MAG: hypothetical protein JNL58_10560 [Planctomyces sp.]|nr:hypothetical protein [Planctomyces sp.]